MKKAGIKVWVLTGDKIETAINIGISCGLLDTQGMTRHELQEVTEQGILKALQDIKEDMTATGGQKNAMVVSGGSLLTLYKLDHLKQMFLDITDHCDVVLACRVSP